MTQQLKKCSVCGKKPDIWETRIGSAFHGSMLIYDVQCPVCSIGTPYGYDTKEKAVKAWNEGDAGKRDIDRKYAKKI